MTDEERSQEPAFYGDQNVGRLVHHFLTLSMVPDPEAAAQYVAPNVRIHFTGRQFTHPREMSAFNAKRYRWVKKRIERYDTVTTDTGHVVYSTGTLYGEWPDGSPFEDNRYVDRFEVLDGVIVRIDVLNESAERLLIRAGAAI